MSLCTWLIYSTHHQGFSFDNKIIIKVWIQGKICRFEQCRYAMRIAGENAMDTDRMVLQQIKSKVDYAYENGIKMGSKR